jgi:hypothetical protein
MRLLRYTHQRVRRQALDADARLLARVQQGLTGLEPRETGPIASGEVGLRWFAEHCRRCLPSSAAVAGTASGRNRARRRTTSPVEA